MADTDTNFPEFLTADFEPPDTAKDAEPYIVLLILALARNVKNLSNEEALKIAHILRTRFKATGCCTLHDATADLMHLVALFIEMLTVTKRICVHQAFVAVQPPEEPTPIDDSKLN